MAEGQLQRDLPSLNEPIIDQANLLSATEKQQLSQRILKLYEEGKGQIGVVIVPTTGQEDILIIPCGWRRPGSLVRLNGIMVC